MSSLADILSRVRRRMQAMKADDSAHANPRVARAQPLMDVHSTRTERPRGIDDHYIRSNSPSRLLGWH